MRLYDLSDPERVSQSCAAFDVPRHLRRAYVRKLDYLPVEAIHAQIVSDFAFAQLQARRTGRDAVAIAKARQPVTARRDQPGNKPFLRIYFDVKLDGKTVVRRRLSRSWVKAFLYMIYAHFSATSVSIANTAGSTQTVSRNTNDWFCNAGADVSNNGINVGTGTAAVTTSDAKLQTPIATGNSSGQLRYLASTVNNLQTNSTENSFQLIRSFVNNSGASITVNEFGIYGDNTGGTNFYCLARDVLETGVAVGNGQTLTITYTISVGL